MHSPILLSGSICQRANLHSKGQKYWKIKIVSGNQSLMEIIIPLFSFSSGQGEFACWFLFFFPFSSTMYFLSEWLCGTVKGRRAASMPSRMKYISSHEGSQLSKTRGRKCFSCFILAPKTLKLLLRLI